MGSNSPHFPSCGYECGFECRVLSEKGGATGMMTLGHGVVTVQVKHLNSYIHIIYYFLDDGQRLELKTWVLM